MVPGTGPAGVHSICLVLYTYQTFGFPMDTCSARQTSEEFSCRLRALPEFAKCRSFLNLSLVQRRTGKRPQTMSCLPHAQMTEQSSDDVFALLIQRANEVVAGKVKIGHSIVSMPSSFPAFHLLESFGAMPSGSAMVPGPDAREFAHIHATYLPDNDPVVLAKKKRGAPSSSARLPPSPQKFISVMAIYPTRIYFSYGHISSGTERAAGAGR